MAGSADDRLRRFLFEGAPLRGHWVRLSGAWREAREHQPLAPAPLSLLGEALAACSLLAGSLKFHGTLSLQLRGSQGGVSMLIAQATHTLEVRGVAHVVPDRLVPDADFTQLTGDGQLVVTVERGAGVDPWQGIVPLEGGSLAACMESYFVNSEQVPTAMVLAADERFAAGLLLQKLPAPSSAGEAEEARIYEIWEEAVLRLRTVSREELLDLDPEVLLSRLFSNETLRLFDGEAVSFACRCGRERVGAMLKGLGRDEIDSILAEQGAVTVTCEFCQRPYRFDAVDVQQLFLENPAGEGSERLN